MKSPKTQNKLSNRCRRIQDELGQAQNMFEDLKTELKNGNKHEAIRTIFALNNFLQQGGKELLALMEVVAEAEE